MWVQLRLIACLAFALMLFGCADMPLGDLDSVKNYNPPATPQQSTYEGVEPSRHVDSNGNDCAGYC